MSRSSAWRLCRSRWSRRRRGDGGLVGSTAHTWFGERIITIGCRKVYAMRLCLIGIIVKKSRVIRLSRSARSCRPRVVARVIYIIRCPPTP